MKLRALASLTLLLVISSHSFSQSQIAKIVQIIDGDTVMTENKNGENSIFRLAYIDAPEITQEYGKRSKRNLEKAILNQKVVIQNIKKDEYGRFLAIINQDGKNVNLEQVKDGYAWSLSRQSSNLFFKAEANARKYRKGFWNKKYPIAPWVYRK